jgi:porin
MKSMKYKLSRKDALRSKVTGPALVLLALNSTPFLAGAEDAPASSPPPSPEGVFEAQGNPLQPKKGPRTTEASEAEAEKPKEWFGSELPWWQWSRVTGNWGGLRDSLENAGATIAGSYTMDWSAPVSGGINRRGTARGLLDVNLTIDAEKLGLPGGTLFAQYYFRHGRNGSDDVGDLQAFSNIDEARLSREYELWFEQKILNEKLRIKAGQVDANSEFAFVEAAGEFINASAGFSPTIFTFPTYPDPALSLNLFVYPLENIYIGAGLYGDTITETSRRGFQEPFWIGEVGAKIPLGDKFGDLRVAAGVFYDTGNLDRFDGGTQNKGNGFYALAENQIWRENPDDKEDAQGLSVFAQYGFGDDKVSAFEHHLGLGLSTLGLIPGRDADAAGFYWTTVKTSRAAGSGFDADESAFEFFYKFEVTPAVSLKPDVQWITNPGGVKAADDALVFTLRLDVAL